MCKIQFAVISFYNKMIWLFPMKYEVNLGQDYSK